MHDTSDNAYRHDQPPAGSGRGLRRIDPETRDAYLIVSIRALLLFTYALVVYTAVLVALALVSVIDLHLMPPWWVNLLALILIGLGIVPVNRWVRHGVEQLIYGWPDDPYATLSRLQASLTQSSSPQAIVPVVAATITATLKLPYAAITSALDGETVSVGAAPAGAERVTISLVYGETIVGSLEVATRRPGTTLSASELQLLHDLARQVGITLHAAQLSEALLASRAQLVTAREEERRRIRRDLHDGLGPTLAALRLQLGAVRRTLRSDPDGAETLLDELRADVADATAAIRRLVYELRPPLLDEHGLAGALQSLSRLIEPTTLNLKLPEALPALPAAVEVALYRIAAEALHNVGRHARATSCTLALEASADEVQLQIVDDGVGLPVGQRAGVGLAAMQERAEELGGNLVVTSVPGGGVTVLARIPWRAEQ
jgi:signal transduction histidine kinase